MNDSQVRTHNTADAHAHPGSLLPRILAIFFTLVCSVTASAVPDIMDWDTLTWVPAGPTNLSETYTVGAHDVVVTFSGNTAFLDNAGSPISPDINDENEGGLFPVEKGLYIAADYVDMSNPEVSVTLDFSDFPGGISNISFSMFDVDADSTFIDEAEVTATLVGGGTVNPTTLTASPNNSVLDANSIQGTGPGPAASPDGNAFFAFSQSGIASITIVYRNNISDPNPGFQHVNLHDISFDAPLTDIAVTKSVDNMAANVGDTVVFTVTATNNGPDSAGMVNILDQLPAGFAYVSDNGGGSYVPGTGIWTAGAFTNGQAKSLDITATVNPVGPYTNTAALDSVDGEDTVPANNSQGVTLTPSPVADLALTKITSTAEPTIGSNVTFTVSVTNNGPSAATNVAVTDMLPAGYAFVSASTASGAYVSGSGIWTIGSIPATNTVTLDIVATVLGTGAYDNTAQVSASDQMDPDSTPNNSVEAEDDQQTVVMTPPEIGLAKTIASGPTANGDGTFTLTYALRVENTGGTPLNSIQIVDDLGATFAGATTFVVDTVTSGTLAANAGFNGVGDQNLLAGTDTLAIGANGTVNVQVTVTPGATLGPYNNTAVANGSSPAGGSATDTSQDGTNVDPDGDGNPGNNSAVTPVTFVEMPEIGLAKALSAGPTSNGDGTFTLTYTLRVENTGDVALNNVQVVDNLGTTFAAATTFVVDTVTSGTLAANAGFNGVGDQNLLAGTDTLAPAASGTVNVQVTVTPGATLGPYNNTAVADGDSPAGANASDTSQDGTNVDPDGDGNPGNNSAVTPVTFAEMPEIGLAKALSAGPTSNGDGTFTLTYALRVENTGDVPLNSLQILDDLGTTFAGATTFVVDTVTSGTLAANAGFNGVGDQNLLIGTDTLAIGASGTVNVQITVTPGATLGPYNNTAQAAAKSPAGAGITDTSQDGTNVDPDGDGNPGNNSAVTPVTFVEMPEIGLAKALSAGPTSNGDGTFTLTYTLRVENTGDVALNNVQVVDNLGTTFAAATTFVVDTVTSGTLAANAGFNGVGDQNLLAGTDTLAPAASGTVNVQVTVTPGATLGPYNNTAVADGDSPAGANASDTSQDGTNVDPDGDGNPGNNSAVTPVTFAEMPEIGLAKALSAGPTSNGDGTFTLTYALRVENTGDVPLNSLQILDDLGTTFAGATTFVVDTVTSGTLAANAGFNGVGDQNLLIGTDTLAIGASGTVNVQITVTPGATLGPYNNTAQAAAKSPAGAGITDTSQDGTNVDPDGDGNPGNNSAVTPVTFAEMPEIGLAKALSAGPTSNGDGTFTLTYALRVENTGDVPLNSLQILDDLGTTFAGATTFVVDTVTSGTLAANAGFNGVGDQNLLIGTDTLAIGASGTVNVQITVTPGATLGPYNNTAQAAAKSPAGAGITDTSQDGTNVDPDGDGNPGNNSAVTPVTFVEMPEIGLAKALSAGPTSNGDGTFTLTYTLRVENTGDVALNNVQVVDNLGTTFAAATTFVVDTVTSGTLAANAGFNGVGDQNLLAGTDTLAPAASGTVNVQVTVTPGATLGPYNNTAVADGDSPAGANASDTSQDGTNVDPDGDGNPGNNSAVTPVTFAEMPEIGLAKALSAGPTSNGDGTFTLTYALRVENTGDVPLNSLQILDDLGTTFAGATTFVVDTVTSGTLAANAGFNGVGDQNLLIGTDTLAIGASGTVNVQITVTPGATLGPYNNTAQAAAKSPAGAGITDTSQDGTNVDPDGDGNPGNNSAVTPVTFAEMPEIGIAKNLGAAPVNNGDGTFTLTYALLVQNTGDVPLNSLQIIDNLGTTFAGATTFVVDAVTSGTLAANAGFNGVGDQNLLIGTDTLATGASGTVDVQVTVTPGADLGPYSNTALAAGKAPSGAGITDTSQNGTNVDPDGDGDPGNNSVATPVTFTELPEIGVAKDVSTAPVNNGDGTYTLTYSMRVENTGDVPLSAVQVTDNLGTTFAGVTTFVVDSITSGTLAANAGFNGVGDQNLLAGTDTLAPAASGTVNVQVTVTPGTAAGPFNNIATGNGTSPAGSVVTDASTDGTNVDPDGDGDPGNNSVVTPVSFTEMPEIGVAKNVSTAAVNNGDGTYTLTYSMRVENTGDVPLSAVQVTDNLGTTFAGVTTFVVDSITSGTLAANAGFNGVGDQNLLAGTDTLAPAASGTVNVQVTVTPGTAAGPFNNIATGNGTSPAGSVVTDASTDGTNVDPDGDGDPGNNSVTTPVSFTEMPEIGVAKNVSTAPVNNGDGTSTLTYTVRVENTGDVPLANLQITENLNATFAGATGFAVVGFSSTAFTVNPLFDGAGNTDLLAGTDTLATGAAGTVDLQVRVTTGGNTGPYNNIASADGTSPAGTDVTDVSTDGTNVDPDGDGDPGNNSVATPVTFTELPEIGVAKDVSTAPVNNGDGSFTLTYAVFVENTGDVSLSAVQVTDNLGTTFAGVSTFVVDGITSGTLAANAGFNGVGDQNLLAGTDTLAPAASGTVNVQVTVTPGTAAGPFNNIATGNGTSPAGSVVTDASTDGTNVDPDGDGDPGNNSVTTPVSFTEMPEIGVAKNVSTAAVNNGDGTYTLTYSMRVENTGDVPLSAVQVTDNLGTTFAGVTTFVVDSITSGTLAANAGFNGVGDQNLLAGTDTLAPAASGTVNVQVTVTPGTAAGPFNNIATGNGTSPAGSVVTDASTDGTNVDPDGDGDPGNNSVVTPVSFTEMPEIGVAKSVSTVPVNNGDGTYTLTYSMRVENTGNVPLANLQITENLSTTFTGATGFAVVGFSSTAFTVNPLFDGAGNTDLLAGTDTLATGAAGTVDLQVRVAPGGNAGPYNNIASADGTSPGGTVVTDVSTDGANVDPDGDGDPGNNSVTTPVSFTEMPEIGVAKNVSTAAVNNGDGTYTLTYSMRVENTGDVPLSAVQVTDNLGTTFAGVTTFVVDSITSGTLAANAGFNGVGDQNLLAGTDTLAPAASGTVNVQVTVTPGTAAGPFNNIATGNGTSPAGSVVTDASTDGTNVDPDGDGDPGNNSVTTPVSFTEMPEIGVAKSVSTVPVNNGDGTYTLTYSMRVENTGSVPLNNIQITDNLGVTFSGATAFAVNSVSSVSLAVNAGFDGVSDQNLLAGTGTLAPAASGTIDVQVTVTPGATAGPYNNAATASGSSPGGATVTDVSTDGTSVDPDGDGNPGNNSAVTPVTFDETPQIGVAKAVSTAPVNNGDGTYTVTYTLLVQNSGNVPLNAVQLVDDLGAAFAGSAAFAVDTVTSTALAVNAGFDGDADQNLLTGTDTLAPAASGSIDVQVTVTPGGALGPYNNAASGSGTSPGGATVSDTSTNGTNVDPDGDGDPGNNAVTTPVTFSEAPQLGVAKAVSTAPVNNGNSTVSLAYTILVANTGDVALDSVQVTDSLATTFAGVSAIVIDSVTSADFTVNPGYDGDGDASLLVGTDSLAVNASGAVTVAITVSPDSNAGPFNNVAMARGLSTAGVVVTDASTTGSDVDPDGDGDPGNNSMPTPVTLPVALAALAGNAWLDANVDDVFNTTETALSGWIIEVVQNDTVVQSTSVAADGTYSVTGLIPGTYNIRLRNPINLATFGLLQNVVLGPGLTVIDQNLPIDPSGVVYDSSSRVALAGATVFLSDAGGTPLPAACLLPNQQAQVTDASGAYRFDVNLGADAACPSGATVTITLTPPAGYAGIPSAVLAPAAGPLVATGGGNPFAVVPFPTAPQAGDATLYYLSFTLSNGDPNIINNHIPLDPPPGNIAVRLSKIAAKTQVTIGELVPYTVTAENLGAGVVSNLVISDLLPAGFSYVQNSAVLNGGGTLNVSGQRPVEFSGINLPVGGSASVSYLLRVGAGVTAGSYRNTATPLVAGIVSGNSASATVAVISDPDFEQTTIIGMVFDDVNRNGYQDAGERGLPGVRLATVAGLIVETDAHGRYHLAGIEGGRFDRGRNFIIKVDPATLPDGSIFTTENPRVKRITQGLMNRFDFGVHLPRQNQGYERIAVKLGEVFFTAGSAQISPAFVAMLDQLAERLRQHGGGKLIITGHDTPCLTPAPTCGAELAKQRALNVLQALERRLGKDMMKNIDIQIGDVLPETSDATAPDTANTVSQRFESAGHEQRMGLQRGLRRGLAFAASLLATTAHAAELPPCTIDACATDDGYAIQIETYTDDRPLSVLDSPAARTNPQRVDIGGEFLIRLPGGGTLWATEDPAAVDPRLAVHAHEVFPVTAGAITQPVDFYIYKNYDAFIDSAELLIYHEADIDRIAPLATIPIGRGDLVHVQWDGRSTRQVQPGDQLYYVVQAFNKHGQRDSTHAKALTAVRASDYDGPGSAAVPRVTDAILISGAAGPLNGNMLVFQPEQEQVQAESTGYRLTPHFATRKTALMPEDRAELDRIIAQWQGTSNVRIFAEGHTDNVRIAPQNRKEFANNQVLSEARAQSVVDYVISKLPVTPAHVQTVGYGPTQPVASNDTATGRAKNRRVELTITGDRNVSRTSTAAKVNLLDPSRSISVPVSNSLEETINILNSRTGSARPQTGRVAAMDCAMAQNAAHQVEAVYGDNDLAIQNIPIYGSRVRLHGQDVAGVHALAVNGNAVPVDMHGKFAVDFMLPVGEHDLNLEFMDSSCHVQNSGTLDVDVSGEHMFVVALADFTAGNNSISGSVEPLSVDDRFDDDFLVEGRLAVYLKGKIKGKYLVTAQVDTKEEELSNLFSNLGDKDPGAVFRRLDPDRYYAVYGDDSTTFSDTDSIGKFYVRADWDKSRAVWGNFHTGYTGSEFTQYNRSLYGGQFDWHSLTANSNGDSRTEVNVFVSENEAALGHAEFRGTGGSLYYLKHTDLLPGSEKLHIEIRDRDSARVLENITLQRGADYEIDEFQGRVMLTRPLMQITALRGPTLIKDSPLDGNDVILLADYEYIPRGFGGDNTTVGARGRHWFGEHFALGGTYVEEGRGGNADYTLMGAEMVLQATPHTYIKAEIAQTEDSQVQRFFSNNGGLDFSQLGPVGNVADRDGDALGIEARINTKEWLNTNNEWVVAGWYRNTEEGFSIARRDDGFEVTESGLELVGKLGANWSVAARASTVERETRGDDAAVALQIDYRLSAASTLSAELRRVKEERPLQGIDGDGTIGALRYTRNLGERWTAYAQGQFTLDNDSGRYDNNDMATVGVMTRLNDRTAVSGEYSTGHRGDSASLSLEHELNHRHRLYGTYTHSSDRTDDLAEDQIGVGQRSIVSDQLTVFNEHQFSEYRDFAGISHVFGLEFAPRAGWSLSASYQTGELETDTGIIDRDSISGSLAYQGERINWSTRLELRDDSGNVSNQEQWLTSNRVDFKLSDSTRVLARYNYSETEDTTDPRQNAEFTEAQIGMAYRPVSLSRFNMLAKFTYLYDLRGFDQVQTGPDQRSNVFSLEGIYRLNQRWDVGGKYAYRTGELRTDRNSGDWFESTTQLYALRSRYHLIRRWDAMAEYRWLDVKEAQSTRDGWLVGIDRHINDNFKFGIGYNFTDYSDDLTNLDYEQQGWFLNAVGKY